MSSEALVPITVILILTGDRVLSIASASNGAGYCTFNAMVLKFSHFNLKKKSNYRPKSWSTPPGYLITEHPLFFFCHHATLSFHT